MIVIAAGPRQKVSHRSGHISGDIRVNVIQLLFTLRPGRHSPAEALAGLGLRVAKSGRFPLLCFFLSPGDGSAWFIAGVDNGFTLALRFARTTMHNTNTTPLMAEQSGVASRGYAL